MTLTHRPCGVCRALVTPAGCRHWHPNQQVDDALAAKRERNAELKRQERAAKRRGRDAVAKRQERADKRQEAASSGISRFTRQARRAAAVERAGAVGEMERVLVKRPTTTDKPIGASVADLKQATGESYQ